MGRAALVLALLCALPARADWLAPPGERDGGVPSGTRAAVERAAPLGLERGMPRDGAYARGILLDAAGDHAGALRAYGEALSEVNGLAELGASPSCAAMWRVKVLWQRQESEKLLEQQAYATVMPSSAVAHLNLATSYHRKLLSVRAFLGRAPRPLWQAAHDQYALALALDGRYAPARIGLAALLVEAGRTPEGRAQFAAVGRRRDDDELGMAVAAYLVATGDREGALAILVRATRQGENRRWALASNDFDALRGDARFQTLVDAASDEAPRASCPR